MATARFPRRAKLLTKSAFRFVFELSKRSSDRYFTVLGRTNTLGYTRLGLAVSRKVDKSAVRRNRIKRLIRESFRHHQGLLDGIDVVVIARAGLRTADASEVADALSLHWQRLAKQCARR